MSKPPAQNMPYLVPFADLVAGISESWLSEFLQVNPKTIKRWKAGTTAAPHAIRLLLRLKLNGDLSALAGETWRGFFLDRADKLHIPYFSRPFDADQLNSLIFTINDAWQDKRDLKHLQQENNALRMALSQTQKPDFTWKNGAIP